MNWERQRRGQQRQSNPKSEPRHRASNPHKNSWGELHVSCLFAKSHFHLRILDNLILQPLLILKDYSCPSESLLC